MRMGQSGRRGRDFCHVSQFPSGSGVHFPFPPNTENYLARAETMKNMSLEQRKTAPHRGRKRQTGAEWKGAEWRSAEQRGKAIGPPHSPAVFTALLCHH